MSLSDPVWGLHVDNGWKKNISPSGLTGLS